MAANLKLVEQEIRGTLEAALEIAEQRANTLRQLRDALESNDDVEALSIARKLCGLNEKSDRVVKGVH